MNEHSRSQCDTTYKCEEAVSKCGMVPAGLVTGEKWPSTSPQGFVVGVVKKSGGSGGRMAGVDSTLPEDTVDMLAASLGAS